MIFSARSIVLFLHVLAGVALIATSLLAPLVRSAVRSAQSGQQLRQWLEFGRRAARGNPAAALALLATGIYLGKDGWWNEAWFRIAIVAWLVNSSLAALVVKRTAAALALAASRCDSGVDETLDRLRWSRAWELAEGTIAANDVALLYVMLEKPAAIESLALLVLANLAVLGTGLLRNRNRRRVPVPLAVSDRV